MVSSGLIWIGDGIIWIDFLSLVNKIRIQASYMWFVYHWIPLVIQDSCGKCPVCRLFTCRNGSFPLVCWMKRSSCQLLATKLKHSLLPWKLPSKIREISGLGIVTRWASTAKLVNIIPKTGFHGRYICSSWSLFTPTSLLAGSQPAQRSGQQRS